MRWHSSCFGSNFTTSFQSHLPIHCYIIANAAKHRLLWKSVNPTTQADTDSLTPFHVPFLMAYVRTCNNHNKEYLSASTLIWAQSAYTAKKKKRKIETCNFVINKCITHSLFSTHLPHCSLSTWGARPCWTDRNHAISVKIMLKELSTYALQCFYTQQFFKDALSVSNVLDQRMTKDFHGL